MGKVAGARIAFFAWAVIAVVTGCGGHALPPVQGGIAGPTGDQGQDEVAIGGWLDFPPVIDGNYSPYRLTSESERTVEGLDYSEAHGAGNYEVPATEDYVIVSGSDDPLAWAAYHLADFDVERPLSLQLTIADAGESPQTDPLPLSCWLGVTDYTTNNWQWYGPFVQPTTLVLNSANRRDRYISADCAMSFALLTLSSSRFASGGNPAGRTAALIDCSVIATLPAEDRDYLVTRPHFASITDVSFGDDGKGASLLETWQYINLYWDHVVDIASQDCEAEQYDVYRRGPGDETRELIGSVDAPTEQYTDPTDNDPGVEAPLPGVTYTYSLRAGNTAGYTSYDSVPATIPLEQPTPDTIIITAYTIRIDSAANGIGFDPELFDADHGAGTIDANSETDLSLEWIEGTFNGLPFSGEDEAGWPEDMTQADYDIAFGAARDNMAWELTQAGAPGCRWTSDWLMLDAGSFPLTGDPGTGVVSPDDDPDSFDMEAEGLLGLLLPDDESATYPANEDLTVSVPFDVYLEVSLDIGFDPVAPVLQGYLNASGNPLSYVSPVEDTFARIPFEWGVNGEPADLGQTSLELHEFQLPYGASMRVAVDFTYVASDPDFGEFTILNDGDDHFVDCIIPGSQLVVDKYYACRLSDGSTWSSINKPGEMLNTRNGGGVQPFITFPEHCWPEIDMLQVFQADPVVRRNPELFYDFETGGLQPEDEIAYNDILKINGDEFFVHVDGGLYPKAAVVETYDPDTITSLEDGIPGILSYANSSGRLLINISLLTYQGGPGDPVRVYCYKFFNADGSSAGWGSFDVAPIGSFVAVPEGVAWGVNVWDREELEIGDRSYDNFTTDGNNVGTSTPDVLWFEIEGGWLFDYDQNEQGTYSGFPPDLENLVIHVQDADQGDIMYCEGAIRIAGLGASGSYLLIHTATNLDWHFPGIPSWPGILRSGHIYDLSLEDPHFPGLEHTFNEQLTVIGTNPNG